MFTLEVPGLTVAYVVVALLLLGFSLGARCTWRLKAAAIVLQSALYVVVYYALPGLLGWPSAAPLPERFRLLAAHVAPGEREPREIVLWALDLDENPARAVPRAYRVPYSELMHTKVEEAGERIRKGLTQVGALRKQSAGSLERSGGGAAGSNAGGQSGQASDNSQAGQASVALEFEDLPPAKFPTK